MPGGSGEPSGVDRGRDDRRPLSVLWSLFSVVREQASQDTEVYIGETDFLARAAAKERAGTRVGHKEIVR